MNLYLVQHAEAVSKEENPDRPLTEKGKKDAQKSVRFLKNNNTKIDIIWHSSKTRAIETANIFKEGLELSCNIQKREDLSPNDPVDKFIGELKSSNEDIMIVGHLPFLQKLASSLLIGSAQQSIISFKQAGVVCLSRQEEDSWQIIFHIIPDLLN